ncbi:MAG: CBS domain-containing protein [Deltaproteobacteria bacterium]|nr:CBS domain-containing protein [Deltaproteobacteria bacterium]MBW2635228.1 CBS domain-containing protein [Deltaproteobacteria bacterium]MBW2678293.1 CBS domain-containing protein [Deltaproteobacteria bacterium]
MKQYLVKDLMVPISEYATVSVGSMLSEAVIALEKAQEEYNHTHYRHRAVLVLDNAKQVVGKLSQLDFLRSLEPQDEMLERIKDIEKFGFSSKSIALQQERYRQTAPPVKDVFAKAAKLKVEDFMQTPSEGEYVNEETSLDTAVHQLINGHHLSLLVTHKKKIVGVLRMSDVFAATFHVMKEVEATE